ncbi:PEP-CTERM sorting domain-containing protein [Luteolibacter sp. SL250]|uniref:PEP-CTERM sorting domain-containing protein n=1 Tax=Luteolibacter sp. SL250 TaxID=2995170 RepID=UPI00226D4E30|nr:PEP-CTERM sorting domain-containing protein [Luteolibacter sp. SL250]WAC20358.1 PEP-CTERM sorting domain-containing protein [Luteolibacter sp. SL250]
MSFSPGKIFLILTSLASFSEAALTVTAIADNYTFKAQADVNQTATAESLAIKVANASQINARTAFFKFDTSAASTVVDGPAAVFQVTNTTASNTLFQVRVYALNSGAAGYNWLAADSTAGAGDGITWNNSPAFSSSATSNYLDLTEVTEVGTFDITNGTAVGGTFQVTLGNWNNFVQADGTLTLISVVYAQTAGGSNMSLGASEHRTTAYRPTLTFVPEPSTMALTALGALPLLRRRR